MTVYLVAQNLEYITCGNTLCGNWRVSSTTPHCSAVKCICASRFFKQLKFTFLPVDSVAEWLEFMPFVPTPMALVLVGLNHVTFLFPDVSTMSLFKFWHCVRENNGMIWKTEIVPLWIFVECLWDQSFIVSQCLTMFI